MLGALAAAEMAQSENAARADVEAAIVTLGDLTKLDPSDATWATALAGARRVLAAILERAGDVDAARYARQADEITAILRSAGRFLAQPEIATHK